MREVARPIPDGLDGGLRRTAPGSKLKIDHRHDWIELNLVVRGVGSYLLHDQVYELKTGTLVWLLPGQHHRLNRSPKLEMWVVSARPELLPANWLPGIAAQPSRVLAGEELIDLDRLLSQVAQDSDEPEVYNAGIRYVITRAWRASNDSPPADKKPMHPAVSRALLLFREQGAALALSELADAAGIAAPYLSRLLVEHTGRSFLEWRNRIRLDRFMEEYKPGANLLNVSFDAGFGSYSRFHHVFTQMVGCAPSEWAKREDGRVGHNAFGVDSAAAPDAFNAIQSTVVSNRLRWTQLVPLASPAIADLLGPRFLERVITQRGESAILDVGADAELDTGLSDGDRRRFITSLAPGHPELAAGLDDMIARHDIAGTFAGLLTEFGLSPSRLADAIAAMVAVLWTSVHEASDPSADTLQALSRQVASALDGSRSRPDRSRAQAALTALLCHFVVVCSAIEATRARADPRASLTHAENAAICAKAMFGSDMKGATLTAHGLRRADTPAAGTS